MCNMLMLKSWGFCWEGSIKVGSALTEEKSKEYKKKQKIWKENSKVFPSKKEIALQAPKSPLETFFFILFRSINLYFHPSISLSDQNPLK